MIVNFYVFLSVPACRHRAPYSPYVSLNPNSDISISSMKDTADKSFQRWCLLHRKSNRLNGRSPSRFFFPWFRLVWMPPAIPSLVLLHGI